MIYRRSRLKRGMEKAAPMPSQKTDIIKLGSFAITLLGITAWVSGAAYDAGYWGAAGLEGGLTAKSLQQTALTGFIGAFQTWVAGTAVIGLIGMLICILALSRKRKKTAGTSKLAVAIREWLGSKFTYDTGTGSVGLAITIGVYFFFFCFLIPLALWSLSAYDEGAKRFRKQVCSMREGKGILTSTRLGDGTSISGRMIDRSEFTSVILDGKALHFIKLTDKPVLLYSLTLSGVECGKAK